MSEEQDKESKTELPTEKKRDTALERGNAPISREASHAMFFATTLIILATAAPMLGTTAEKLKLFLAAPGQFQLQTAADVALLLRALATELLPVVALPAAALLIGGIASTALQTPPRIAWDRIKPTASRISPSAGWKRITGAHGMAELVKGLAKLAAVGFIGWWIVNSDTSPIFTTWDTPLAAIPALSLDTLAGVLRYVVAAAIAFAIGDWLWTRHRWIVDLKMTRQEVRDEHRQQEGDPIVASRRRALARARSRKRMLANVGRATLVVANPTHYAVAMRYVRAEGGAPYVVAKGQDLIALEIRRRAEEQGIPVVEDKALARSLFDVVEVDRPIPAAFYRAVAEILIMLQRRGNGRATQALGARR